jgi:hypothetical protein
VALRLKGSFAMRGYSTTIELQQFCSTDLSANKLSSAAEVARIGPTANLALLDSPRRTCLRTSWWRAVRFTCWHPKSSDHYNSSYGHCCWIRIWSHWLSHLMACRLVLSPNGSWSLSR